MLEQTLGHVTHALNLRTVLRAEPMFRSTFLDVIYDMPSWAVRLPMYSNWTVRSGLRARRAVRYQFRRAGIDVMFIHTQVPAVFVGRWMHRVPTIVSLDATGEQYDEMGVHYAHHRSNHLFEVFKKREVQRCFRRARHIVTWSDWARQSVIDDYGTEPERVTVIAPGVDIDRWSRPASVSRQGPTKILFVGGDLERKGATALLEAARRLRDDPSIPPFEVQLVTVGDVEPQPGVVVHSQMHPNSDALISLYHRADIFCLPTKGDCLPMVLLEAGAAGLPIVATDVGAISEIVTDDITGILIEPGDVSALEGALRRLLVDPELRARLGASAQDAVRTRFDARTNALRVGDLLREVATQSGLEDLAGRRQRSRSRSQRRGDRPRHTPLRR